MGRIRKYLPQISRHPPPSYSRPRRCWNQLLLMQPVGVNALVERLNKAWDAWGTPFSELPPPPVCTTTRAPPDHHGLSTAQPGPTRRAEGCPQRGGAEPIWVCIDPSTTCRRCEVIPVQRVEGVRSREGVPGGTLPEVLHYGYGAFDLCFPGSLQEYHTRKVSLPPFHGEKAQRGKVS